MHGESRPAENTELLNGISSAGVSAESAPKRITGCSQHIGPNQFLQELRLIHRMLS
jgi:hypothetical protein